MKTAASESKLIENSLVQLCDDKGYSFRIPNSRVKIDNGDKIIIASRPSCEYIKAVTNSKDKSGVIGWLVSLYVGIKSLSNTPLDDINEMANDVMEVLFGLGYKLDFDKGEDDTLVPVSSITFYKKEYFKN